MQEHHEGAMSPKKILVVDDSSAVRLLMWIALSDAGFLVEEAGTVQEGRDLLRNHADASLVVCDWNLPDGEGLTLLREARADAHTGHVLFAVVSVEPEALYGEVARAAGASAYLVKPFEPSQLVDVVRRLTS
jgi:two-component system chemotaxis response regulator CheY